MRRVALVLLDLVMLLVSLASGGPGPSLRVVLAVLAAVVAVLVIVCGVILVLGLVAQRRPPYPI